MDFNLGTMEEAKQAADQSEYAGGQNVDEPGAYVGIVDSAVYKVFDSGSGFFQVIMTVTDGEQAGKACKAMLLTMKKDGTSTCKPNAKGEKLPLPGINQIRGGLMPVLRKKDLNGVVSGDEIVYPDVVGQPLGMLVNIKKSNGKHKDGSVDTSKVYNNTELQSFFHPTLDLCGSEILAKSKEPKKKAKILKGLRVIDETIKDGETAGGGAGGDLFNDAAAGAGSNTDDDPFGEDDSQAGAGTGTTEKKEVKKDPVKEKTVKKSVEKSTEKKTEDKPEDDDSFWEE